MMEHTVYVLGAGANKAIKIKSGVKMKFEISNIPEVSPPLGGNFFQEALAMQFRLFNQLGYNETLASLYAYI